VEQGAKVAIADMRLDQAENLAEELGEQAIAVEMDVTSEDSVIEAVRQVTELHGPPDITVATVGIGEVSGCSMCISMARFSR
jgi:3alpha(or 20beta)-hydroxysteroid dehydrogenase